jgi:hypothetical protein
MMRNRLFVCLAVTLCWSSLSADAVTAKRLFERALQKEALTEPAASSVYAQKGDLFVVSAAMNKKVSLTCEFSSANGGGVKAWSVPNSGRVKMLIYEVTSPGSFQIDIKNSTKAFVTCALDHLTAGSAGNEIVQLATASYAENEAGAGVKVLDYGVIEAGVEGVVLEAATTYSAFEVPLYMQVNMVHNPLHGHDDVKRVCAYGSFIGAGKPWVSEYTVAPGDKTVTEIVGVAFAEKPGGMKAPAASVESAAPVIKKTVPAVAVKPAEDASGAAQEEPEEEDAGSFPISLVIGALSAVLLIVYALFFKGKASPES